MWLRLPIPCLRQQTKPSDQRLQIIRIGNILVAIRSCNTSMRRRSNWIESADEIRESKSLEWNRKWCSLVLVVCNCDWILPGTEFVTMSMPCSKASDCTIDWNILSSAASLHWDLLANESEQKRLIRCWTISDTMITYMPKSGRSFVCKLWRKWRQCKTSNGQTSSRLRWRLWRKLDLCIETNQKKNPKLNWPIGTTANQKHSKLKTHRKCCRKIRDGTIGWITQICCAKFSTSSPKRERWTVVVPTRHDRSAWIWKMLSFSPAKHRSVISVCPESLMWWHFSYATFAVRPMCPVQHWTYRRSYKPICHFVFDWPMHGPCVHPHLHRTIPLCNPMDCNVWDTANSSWLGMARASTVRLGTHIGHVPARIFDRRVRMLWPTVDVLCIPPFCPASLNSSINERIGQRSPHPSRTSVHPKRILSDWPPILMRSIDDVVHRHSTVWLDCRADDSNSNCSEYRWWSARATRPISISNYTPFSWVRSHSNTVDGNPLASNNMMPCDSELYSRSHQPFYMRSTSKRVKLSIFEIEIFVVELTLNLILRSTDYFCQPPMVP